MCRTGFALFTAAAIVGWACGRLLEGLHWGALGWARIMDGGAT